MTHSVNGQVVVDAHQGAGQGVGDGVIPVKADHAAGADIHNCLGQRAGPTAVAVGDGARV